jgi:protein arginine kinase activator
MNCEKCNKNHATYHLTAIENGVKKEAHLCEECARNAGVGMKFNFTIGDILGTLVEPKSSKVQQIRCPDCGISYSEFKAKARLGCARDYEVFKGGLLPLLEKIHGATTHTGKAPQTADVQVKKENELLRLKKDLESVVKSEDFEKAAEIRDRIKMLEADLNP